MRTNQALSLEMIYIQIVSHAHPFRKNFRDMRFRKIAKWHVAYFRNERPATHHNLKWNVMKMMNLKGA